MALEVGTTGQTTNTSTAYQTFQQADPISADQLSQLFANASLSTPDPTTPLSADASAPLSGIAATEASTLIAAAAPSRLPPPQAYVIAASITLDPKTLAGLPQTPLPLGTRILVAGLAEASKVDRGDFLNAFQGGTLFVSVTLPGAKTSTVYTVVPNKLQAEIGQGIAKPFSIGVANGAFFGNYRTGGSASSVSTIQSANIGVLIGSPALSSALSGALSNAVRAGGGAIATALAASQAGARAAPSAVAIGELLARVVSTGQYYVGAAYGGSISAGGDSVRVRGPGGDTTVKYEDFVKGALGQFIWDPRNFGIVAVAYAKTQFQLANGSSYFQLSPATGGWDTLSRSESSVTTTPYQNFGDAGLALINYLNVWGHLTAQPAGSGGTSPLTYRDLTPPSAANGLPSRFYVRQYQNLKGGAQAVDLVAYLKSTLSPVQFQSFLEGLRPLAEPLGFNFGLSELNPTAPTDPTLKQVRSYFLRDWNKDSRPRETRTIQQIPAEIYNRLKSDLGIPVATTGGLDLSDYISTDVPRTDPSLDELLTDGVQAVPGTDLTPGEIDLSAENLAQTDGFQATANDPNFFYDIYAGAGDDTIDLSTATKGKVSTSEGDDKVSLTLGSAGNLASFNFPPDLQIDGGDGTDTLVVTITTPLKSAPTLDVAQLPANITNFEKVELNFTLLPPDNPTPDPNPGEQTNPYNFRFYQSWRPRSTDVGPSVDGAFYVFTANGTSRYVFIQTNLYQRSFIRDNVLYRSTAIYTNYPFGYQGEQERVEFALNAIPANYFGPFGWVPNGQGGWMFG